MAIDREDTLKKAEKLLRQGRLDAAIAEYVRVVEDQPRDWTTANTLGDLYVRAGQSERAVAQYARIAEHFFEDGFYPKAAALYKKILKITPDDETSQMRLADLSVKQGLLADAKSHMTAVAAKRRNRGDQGGADEILIRLGSIDPSDFDARLTAARVVAESGDAAQAAARFRELHADFLDKGRAADALEALREAVRLDPTDRAGRGTLARAAIAAGDFDTARAYLDRETAGEDPELLMALLGIELRSGNIDAARELLPAIFAIDPAMRQKVADLGWTLVDSHQQAAFVCVDTVVDAAIAEGNFEDAATILQEFVTRLPTQVEALLKLVEVCVDGGLESTMYEAQAQLADAYLGAGQAAEARVIAEDLVAREPWEPAHIERFRRALVMLRVPEPDSVIAERLSGQTPFMANDPFAESSVEAPSQAHAALDDSPPPTDTPVTVDAVVVEEISLTVEVEEEVPPSPRPEPPPQLPTAAPSKARAKGPMEIDLTSALGELEASTAMPVPATTKPPRESLAEVFQDFREEVSQRETADQSAQHMTLGKTYLEMGMHDDAISALRTAARSPRQRFEAGSLLARIYQERGDAVHAIEWLERAAEAPSPTQEAGHALLYQLGATLEAAGETARALAVFLELQADAGEYRDVEDRVERLARVQTGG